MSVLTDKRQDALEDFLMQCQKFRSFDANFVRDVANLTIKYLTASKEGRSKLYLNQQLENRWYNGLANGIFDYDVYNTDDYIAELWACWIVYSKKYLTDIQKPHLFAPVGIAKAIEPVNFVVDVGCGFGYTTAGLKEIFTNATVVGTNLENTIQMDVARNMGKKYGFEVYPDFMNIKNRVDLVFASEYFEHIHEPIEHLHQMVKTLNPRSFLIANAFGTRAVGHFLTYNVGGKLIDGKMVSKIFNNELRRLGYKKVQTKLWNNRPSFWVKMS